MNHRITNLGEKMFLSGSGKLRRKYGDDYQCHFAKGSELANYRMEKLQETLDRLALESERAQFFEVAISDFDRLPKMIDDFVTRVEEIGPNPYKEF